MIVRSFLLAIVTWSGVAGAQSNPPFLPVS